LQEQKLVPPLTPQQGDPHVTVSAFPRRVSPKLGSDPHARRWARAASAASAVRTYSMIESVDDAGSGAPSPAGRRLMHALASLASTSLYSDVRKRAQATLQDVADARFLDARTLVDPIVALLAANRGAVTPELEKERDARVTGALHTLTFWQACRTSRCPRNACSC
jgi:hypothetical protein